MGLFLNVDMEQVIRGTALLAASQAWANLTVTMKGHEETVLHTASVFEVYIREGYEAARTAVKEG